MSRRLTALRLSLCALFVLALDPSALAQESSREMLGTPPAHAEAESHPLRRPAEASAPRDEEGQRRVEPSQDATGANAEAQRDLVPSGEEELMAAHPVNPGGIRFVPGSGLEVASADGRFRLRTRIRAQLRWTLSSMEDGWAQRLRLRRARVLFTGNTFHEDLYFKFELAFSPNDVGIRDDEAAIAEERRPAFSPLLDFYFEFRHLRDLEVRVGQSKVPSNRQRVISSGNLQLVDRSILNAEFTLDRDIGIDLRSRDFLGLDKLRYYAGVFLARGRDSQGFDDFGMMYLARLEVLPFGRFSDYSEVDFERGGPRLSLGVAGAFIDGARGERGILGPPPADGGSTDTAHFFADALFKARGFSASAEFAWRRGSRNPGDLVDEFNLDLPTADPRNGAGLSLQAGYLVPRVPFEVAFRYAFVRGLGSTSLPDRSELVAGISYYPGRHPYKLQLDYTRIWSDAFSDGSHQIRLQLQASL